MSPLACGIFSVFRSAKADTTLRSTHITSATRHLNRASVLKKVGTNELSRGLGNAAEITSLIELKHAAERQEGRSHAGAWERGSWVAEDAISKSGTYFRPVPYRVRDRQKVANAVSESGQ